MKHLLLLRHAKAEPADGSIPDRDRPLAARGHRDAGLIGAAIADDPPDLILCSPALRTRETAADVSAQFARTLETIFVEQLYGSTVDAYLEVIAGHGGAVSRLMVVGHNPTIHQTAVVVAKKPGDKLKAKFPTCSLAEIALDLDDWKDMRPRDGELVRFLRPKDLGAADADD